MSVDIPIVFLETEKLRMRRQWRVLVMRKRLNEEEEIAKKNIEEDMAEFEQAIDILREHIPEEQQG